MRYQVTIEAEAVCTIKRTIELEAKGDADAMSLAISDAWREQEGAIIVNDELDAIHTDPVTDTQAEVYAKRVG